LAVDFTGFFGISRPFEGVRICRGVFAVLTPAQSVLGAVGGLQYKTTITQGKPLSPPTNHGLLHANSNMPLQCMLTRKNVVKSTLILCGQDEQGTSPEEAEGQFAGRDSLQQ